jgi:hypothetical protein
MIAFIKSVTSEKSLRIFAALYLVALFYLYQQVSLGTPICFDDCGGYIPLMGKKIKDYFDVLWTMYRPWTVPVFFSMFGKYTLLNASKIMLAQSYIGFFSWILLAYSCRMFFSLPASKTIAFVVLSLMMFGQGHYHLNQMLLSDSLALSLVLIQLSLCLMSVRYMEWCGKQKRPNAYIVLYIIVLVVVSAAEMGARDANILLALFGGFIVLFYNRHSVLGPKHKVFLVVMLLAIGLTQSAFAMERHKINAVHILAGAILPNEEARSFYVKHGMPPELGVAGSKMKPQELGKVDIAELAKQSDTVSAIAPAFILKSEKIYPLYLLTHPLYVIDNIIKNNGLIFGQRFHPMIDPHPVSGAEPIFVTNKPGHAYPIIKPKSVIASPMDWLPGPVKIVIIIGYLLYAAFFWRTPKAVLPLIVMLAGSSNAVLAFFGDIWEPSEMTRHAFIGSIVFRIGIALAGLLLIEGGLRVGERYWRPGKHAVK